MPYRHLTLCLILVATAGLCANAEEMTLRSLHEGIADIEFVAISKPREVFSIDVRDGLDTEKLLLERVDGSIRAQGVVLYTLSIGPFFDFVIFDEPTETAAILRFFEQRWKWIETGIESGFLHFNEDYGTRFIRQSVILEGLWGLRRYGSVFGNRIFNKTRANYMVRYATHLRTALEALNATQPESDGRGG